MESKKTKKSNLESKRTYFLQIGFVVALALTLIAFEWSTPVNSPSFEYYGADDDVPEEIIPITINQPAPPPPPIIAPDILIISDDFPELEAPIEFMTSEFTEDYFPSAITLVDDTPKDEIFLFVDQMPVFPGGEDALLRFLASTVRYPSDALHNNIDGRVFVQFVIDAKGKVTNVTIIRSVHPSLDREALRVVNSMPDWTPGMQNGRRVRVSYTVPIMFKLQTY